jgi:ABC-2 type transport system permease protein
MTSGSILRFLPQYPRSIYDGVDSSRFEAGEVLQFAFSWVIPILLVVTIPAQTITGMALDPRFAVALVLLTLACMVVSRRVFLWSLNAYRGASS